MKSSLYDTERVKKISQIMPEFAKVARPGDEVYMGLQGDPCFPQEYLSERPTAIIDNVDLSNPEEAFVTLKTNRGEEKTISSLSLKPNDVWEFTDKAFRGVLDRENALATSRAESMQTVSQPQNDENTLRQEIRELRAELTAERENSRNFQNTIIASMKEMANDILKIDANQNRAEFSKVFSSEYTKMENRAEAAINRGEDDVKSTHPMTTRNRGETPMGMFSDSDDSLSDYDSDM